MSFHCKRLPDKVWASMTVKQKLDHAIDTIPDIEIPEPKIVRTLGDNGVLFATSMFLDHPTHSLQIVSQVSRHLFLRPLDHQVLLEMVLVHGATRYHDLRRVLEGTIFRYPQVLVSMRDLEAALEKSCTAKTLSPEDLNKIAAQVKEVSEALGIRILQDLSEILKSPNSRRSLQQTIASSRAPIERGVEQEWFGSIEAQLPRPLRGVNAYYAQIAYGIQRYDIDLINWSTERTPQVGQAIRGFARSLLGDLEALDQPMQKQVMKQWDPRVTAFIFGQTNQR